MDRPRPSPKRWRRWLRRLVIGFALVVIGVFIGIPTAQAFLLHFRVMRAVNSAQSVRLEAFDFMGNVLAKAELDRKQRREIAAAMPLLPDIGVPGLMALCFVPRHRIVTQASSGQAREFLVCFECDQLGFFDSLVSSTPFFWRSPLRRLFSGHGVRVQEPSRWEEKYKLSLRLEGTAMGRA